MIYIGIDNGISGGIALMSKYDESAKSAKMRSNGLRAMAALPSGLRLTRRSSMSEERTNCLEPTGSRPAIDLIKCNKCGNIGMHVHEDDEWGYALTCFCGEWPTGLFWPDSSGPYREAEKLLNDNSPVLTRSEAESRAKGGSFF